MGERSCFENLQVWVDAKNLAVQIYEVTNREKFLSDFGLRDQIRRSAVSIPSNIAEGDERGSNKESVRFLYIAKGSLAELITQLRISYEIGYLNDELLDQLINNCYSIGKKLGALIKVRERG